MGTHATGKIFFESSSHSQSLGDGCALYPGGREAGLVLGNGGPPAEAVCPGPEGYS